MQATDTKAITPIHRAALHFDVAAVAVGSSASATAKALEPDAELIALADRIMANDAESTRISDEIDLIPVARREDWRARDRRHEREVRPLVEANWDLRMELAEARATTIEGFRAKARVIQAFSNCALGFADSFNDDAMAWSLANDLLGVASIWRPEDEEETVA
jgi:hypothetical protein